MGQILHVTFIVWLDKIQVILRFFLVVQSTEDIHTGHLTELCIRLALHFDVSLTIMEDISAFTLSAVLFIEIGASLALNSTTVLLWCTFTFAGIVQMEEIRLLYPHYPCVLHGLIYAWVPYQSH